MGGGSFGSSSTATYVFSCPSPWVNAAISCLSTRLLPRMGGGELARDFLKDDVVDELYLGIVPVLLGEGIPLFPSGFPQRNFTLVENKTYSKGLIALKYKRSRRTQIVSLLCRSSSVWWRQSITHNQDAIRLPAVPRFAADLLHPGFYLRSQPRGFFRRASELGLAKQHRWMLIACSQHLCIQAMANVL